MKGYKILFHTNVLSFRFSRNILKPKVEAITHFNKNQSKYKLDSSITQDQVTSTMKSIPIYLKNEFDDTSNLKLNNNNFSGKFKVITKEKNNFNNRNSLKSGKRMLIKKGHVQFKPKKAYLLKQKREATNALFEQKKYEFLSKSDKKTLYNNDWSINRHNTSFVSIEKKRLASDLKKLKEKNKEKNFNTELFKHDFKTPERLDRRLARLGLCSRSYADKLISKGLVKVDGVKVSQNVLVNDKNNISLLGSKGISTPIKQSYRLWIFHKPQNFVSTKSDPRVRFL